MGFPVAIKRLKMNEENSDRSFRVPSVNPTHYHHSYFTQRLCREIICWKHLSHPNVLPLLGVSVSTDPPCFRILTEWMSGGSVMQYARSNPDANRLKLVSLLVNLPHSPLIHQHPVALWSHLWCGLPPWTQYRSWGSQRGRSNVLHTPFTSLTSETGEHPC